MEKNKADKRTEIMGIAHILHGVLRIGFSKKVMIEQ